MGAEDQGRVIDDLGNRESIPVQYNQPRVRTGDLPFFSQYCSEEQDSEPIDT